MTRSDPQEPSGSKYSRLSRKGRRGKEREKTAMEEQNLKEEMESMEQEAIKAQEAADFDLANQIQAEAELDARKEEAEAWSHQQAINPDTNPLLMPREER